MSLVGTIVLSLREWRLPAFFGAFHSQVTRPVEEDELLTLLGYGASDLYDCVKVLHAECPFSEFV